eukprot:scaffold137_cov398-Prasinococcus_capsulatus_cf.AAC.27
MVSFLVVVAASSLARASRHVADTISHVVTPPKQLPRHRPSIVAGAREAHAGAPPVATGIKRTCAARRWTHCYPAEWLRGSDAARAMETSAGTTGSPGVHS